MDLEDLLSSLHIGKGHDDLPVEAARTQKRRIQDIGAIRGRNEDDALVGFEAVHLDQKRVQGLLALVVTAAQPCAAVASDGVDLIDEDDAGSIFLALREEVPHAGGADADEHLDEVRAADREEGHIGLTGDGPGQKRFPRTRGPHEENPLGNPPAEAGEFLRIPQKVDDLLQLRLGLVDAGHVVEGHLFRLVRHEPGLALAEGHGLASPGLHLAHEEDPDADEKERRQPGDEHRHVPRRILDGLGRDPHALFLEQRDQRCVLGGVGLEALPVEELSRYVFALDAHLDDLALFGGGDEVAEDDVFLGILRLIEEIIQQHEDEADDQPESDIFL